ncbi:hypothetical protein DFP72DRAFT_631016 [Ephemerocybe angulata]|uniref:Uncharacterized protein n=1 Tax=Ephemerocybe angulata TaxID=980116 RepID=A0A8H6IA78_9AGAR|nr:hypothetical protein DFP72DRAFT_631016 [Tulosesus angulatus]
MHSLWSSYVLDSPAISYEQVTTFLRRSGTLPKSLELCGGSCLCSNTDEAGCYLARPTVIQLLTEGPSLHHLYLDMAKYDCFRTLIDSLQSHDPSFMPRPWQSIQSIGLSFSDECHPHLWRVPPTVPSAFIYIPSITSLELQLPSFLCAFDAYSYRDSESAVIGLPATVLSRLVSFIVQCDWKGSHILGMLENCSNLEELTVDFYGDPMSLDNPEDPVIQRLKNGLRVSLPRLRTLTLQDAVTIELLDHIQAPALVKLNLEFNVERVAVFSAGAMRTFLASSMCSLRSLSIHDCDLKARDLTLTLSRIPSLAHLTMDNVVVVPADFWGALIPENGSTAGPLHSLQNLTLLRLPYNYPLGGGLYDFLAKRFLWGSRQCKLTISFINTEPLVPPPLIANFNACGVFMNILGTSILVADSC